MKKYTSSGFTLLELLIVVTIIGIIASILIPNLLVGINQSKQIKTKECLSGSIPPPPELIFKNWPPPGAPVVGCMTQTMSGGLRVIGTGTSAITCTSTLTAQEKEQLSVYDSDTGAFINDDWGTPYQGVKCSGDGLAGAVCVTSAGSDGQFETGPIFSERYPGALTFRDICICDGDGVNRGYILLPDRIACAKEGKICRPGLCCPGFTCGTDYRCI